MYFLFNTFNYPYIYIRAKGDLIEIKQRYVNNELKTFYKFKNINLLESDEVLEKYLDNCTINTSQFATKLINLKVTDINMLGLDKKNIFNIKYNNLIINIIADDVFNDSIVMNEKLQLYNIDIQNWLNKAFNILEKRQNSLNN